jgi:small subunit ribosomal protein S1
VEIPEQVVQVNQDVNVKIIDIDLERRRISLSVKQASESGEARAAFDPYQYGMAPAFDETGKYIGPEGFNPETGEWKSGFEDQKKEWEKQYSEALAKWQAEQDQKKANPELAKLSDKLDSNN